jgi:hypothetical protein
MMDAQTSCNTSTTAKAITNISRQPGIPTDIVKALNSLAPIVEMSEAHCSCCDKISELPEIVKGMKLDNYPVLSRIYLKLQCSYHHRCSLLSTKIHQ